MRGATGAGGTAYPSKGFKFTPTFLGGVYLVQSFVCCEVFCGSFVFLTNETAVPIFSRVRYPFLINETAQFLFLAV